MFRLKNKSENKDRQNKQANSNKPRLLAIQLVQLVKMEKFYEMQLVNREKKAYGFHVGKTKKKSGVSHMRFFFFKLKHLEAQRIETVKTNIKQLNFSIHLSLLFFLLFHIVLAFYYTKKQEQESSIFLIYLFDIQGS